MRRRFSTLWLLAIAGSLALRLVLGADEPADPRVVAAWAAGPFEARVAFDRPIGAGVAAAVVGKSIAFDESRPTVRSKPFGRRDVDAARCGSWRPGSSTTAGRSS